VEFVKRINTVQLGAIWRHRLPRVVAAMVAAYVVYQNGLPLVARLVPGIGRQVPTTWGIVQLYMLITVMGILMYASADREGWQEITDSARRLLTDDAPTIRRIRWVVLVAIPLLAAGWAYSRAMPSLEPPLELRAIHPAPPVTIQVGGQARNIQEVENPLRELSAEEQRAAIEAGKAVYMSRCVLCHGDALAGDGLFSDALNPIPADFTDPGTIAQLQEAYLFWRISRGGPGLPPEAKPWNSGMPAWGGGAGDGPEVDTDLTDDQIWQVIMYLYDVTGYSPRTWE
jgi:hypothetical protein